jgi:hypothetical protein
MRPSGLGGIDQLAAFAGPLLCQGGVAAADQPLPGIVRVADLGQVLLIEQRQLQRPILSGQRGHRRGAQRAHPAEPAGRPQRLDAGGGEHATIPDDDHLRQPEPVPEQGGDLGERGRVGGVAGEHPRRNGPARRVGEQPVGDLRIVPAGIPGVPEGGQRAAASGHPGAGHIEQRHAALG